MITFFVSVKDKYALYDYADLNCPEHNKKEIGKSQSYCDTIDGRWYAKVRSYQQVRMDIKVHDFTAMKLMFDIKHSLF